MIIEIKTDPAERKKEQDNNNPVDKDYNSISGKEPVLHLKKTIIILLTPEKIKPALLTRV